MTNKLLLPSILSIALLQACGGGGGGNATSASPSGSSDAPAATVPATPEPTPATPQSANTGSVSAPFVAGAQPRYQLTSSYGQSFGKPASFAQAESGAVTTLGDTVLSGGSITKDIAGDATYAIGRWVAGTVTSSSGAQTLTGTDNRAYHYIVVNAVPQFPASGAKTCDAGVFTAPTYVNGGGIAVAGEGTGAASGSASLNFGTGGAEISGAINVAASGSSGAASLNGTVAATTSTTITGAYLANGAGAAIQIGDGGDGAYLVAAAYAATLANGARYIGVARFRCA